MTRPLRITPASAPDVDAVCLLLLGQFSEHRIAMSPEALRVAVAGLVGVPDRGAVLVAREGSADVGVAVLATTWPLGHGGRVAWLADLSVAPERRDFGFADAPAQRA